MTEQLRGLVVDDDPDTRDLVSLVLEAAGIDVIWAVTGADAIALVREHRPDLITLDLSLPDMDGTDVCRRIREFSDAYIIMITGRSSEIDRLLGLEIGADDYLAKPFSPRELRARASALLRRPRIPVVVTDPGAPGSEPGGGVDPDVDLGHGLTFAPTRHVMLLGGEPLPLTPAETDLLSALARRPGVTWERGELVREVWKGDFIESDFLVDVHVANVRRKLRVASGGRDWIRTVGGAGYCFDPA